MSQPRKRQPRELLGGIEYHTLKAQLYIGQSWQRAARMALKDIYKLLDAMPPDPPRRPSYYGAKGSLRNPHH